MYIHLHIETIKQQLCIMTMKSQQYLSIPHQRTYMIKKSWLTSTECKLGYKQGDYTNNYLCIANGGDGGVHKLI
jgi:hypothetical protein